MQIPVICSFTGQNCQRFLRKKVFVNEKNGRLSEDESTGLTQFKKH